MKKTTVGEYGAWLAQLLADRPAELSFRRPEFRSVGSWRRQAWRKAHELLAPPEISVRDVRVARAYEWDGLELEELSWQLPYGERTEAVFMKPAGARGRLPAVLALHDHAGNKWLGWRKIARNREKPAPIVRKHVANYYEGEFWATRLARRGYAVLVHDAFAFASRRIRVGNVLPRVRAGFPSVEPRTERAIWRYNDWAGGHEHVLSKALFDAGTTWPGAAFAEDKAALGYLASRKDVDARRIGCGGLSGGGSRTAFLAGLDHRIRCAVCVGFMSTWRDFALDSCWTHTWMIHVPHVSRYLDFPEILGIRVPLPAMVLNDWQDNLFLPREMIRADRILRAVYKKAGAPEKYRCNFHPGPHKFDRKMQGEAFGWFDRWLR